MTRWVLTSALLVAGISLLGVSPRPMAGQSAAEAGVGAVWQSYRLGTPIAGIKELSLLTVPVAFSSRLGSSVALDVRGAWAEGKLRLPGGDERAISGPTDVEITLARAFGRDALVFGLVGVLPTGKATHTIEEAEVAAAISADLLPFRISHWGSGGGVGGNLAVARTVAGFGMGASVGYVLAADFEPRSDEPLVFQPGNLFRATAVVDRTVGGASKLSLRVGMQRYGEDAVEGSNLFRSGNRYDVMASYAFAAGARSSALLYAGGLHRNRGSYLADLRTSPSQDLVLAGGAMRAPMGGAVFTPSVDLRIFRRSDGVGQGYVAGVGGAFELAAGTATLIPSARVRLGSVELNAQESSRVTGMEAGLMVRFGRVRR